VARVGLLPRFSSLAMIEFYPQIKAVHVVAIGLSGGLFALRGALVLLGVRSAMAAPVRALSIAIDTVLLTAALMLLTILKLNPFQVPWLGVKLGLLLVYIVLASFALKRAQGRARRARFYVAALLCYGFMVSIARSHQPWGLLSTLLR